MSELFRAGGRAAAQADAAKIAGAEFLDAPPHPALEDLLSRDLPPVQELAVRLGTLSYHALMGGIEPARVGRVLELVAELVPGWASPSRP